MSHYALANQVFFVDTIDGGVFLDLRTDEYLGVSRAESQLISRLLGNEASASPDTEMLIESLMNLGLVTTSPSQARVQPRTNEPAIQPPQQTLLDPYPGVRPTLHAHHFINFALSYIHATIRMRFGLRPCVRHLTSLYESASRRSSAGEPTDLISVIKVFRYLRPLFFKSRENCLLHSYVMASFLARYGAVATMVIGVKAAPFEAHCWIQVDGMVLTEYSEMVQCYAPILQV